MKAASTSSDALPLIERILPGSRRRISAIRRPRPTRAASGKAIDPVSYGRVEAMLRLLPQAQRPRGAAAEEAARHLEPLHTGLTVIVGPGRTPFRKLRGEWRGYLDAACGAAGLPPSGLRFVPGRLAVVSDALAVSLVPLALDAPEDWDVEADMRTAAARILWGRRDLLDSLAVMARAEALPAGSPPSSWLPAPLARTDRAGWARLVRAEAAALHGDPGEWWVPEP